MAVARLGAGSGEEGEGGGDVEREGEEGGELRRCDLGEGG